MARVLFVLAFICIVFTSARGDDVILRCCDFELTVDDFRFEVRKLGRSYRLDGSFESRRALAENLLARALLAEEGEKFIADIGQAESAARLAEKQALAKEYRKWRIKKRVESLPRIKSLRWRQYLSRKLYIKELVFKARGRAEEALEAFLAGYSFDEVSDRFSSFEGVEVRDIGWVIWKEVPREVAYEIFQLKPGEFTDIVKLGDGYHIMYLAEDEEIDIIPEVLYLRAKRFDRALLERKLIKEERRELSRKYKLKFNPQGIFDALKTFEIAFSGGMPSENLLKSVVATYIGGKVTVANLYSYYFSLPELSRGYVGDAYAIQEFALDVVLPELEALAGYDMNMERKREVMWHARRAREDVLMQVVEDRLRSEVRITDQDIKNYYEERKKDIVSPTRYRVRRILIESQDELEKVLEELSSGADFASVARRWSHDRYSVSKGGDLGYINTGIIAVYDSVVSTLKVGDISSPFRTNDGIEVLKLEDYQQGRPLSLEEAKPYIETFVANTRVNQMLKDWLERKKEECDFYINEELLREIPLPEPEWKEEIPKPRLRT